MEEALDGRTPDYLVVSHLEPDHAANIGLLAEKYPDMKIVGNATTFRMLPDRLDVQRGGFLQHSLHLGAIFAHDIEIVAGRFRFPLILDVQGPELAEPVGGSEGRR